MPAIHPRQALFDPEERTLPRLPACDHYAGVEPRMRKSLRLQAELSPQGRPLFDVTLDCEDGAAVGGELEHAQLVRELLESADNRHGRVGVRLLPLQHRQFEALAQTVLRAAKRPAYLMLPKVRSLADIDRALRLLDALDPQPATPVPLHALVETHGALREVFAIAAHPRVESLSFGLMDFVSAHRGAIPAQAMGGAGQFDHPLVVRAKLEIAAACHAAGKTPSHCVFTEFKDLAALRAAAEMASRLLGYTRMWSIHPDQIRPIVEAFAPTRSEVEQAASILQAAQALDWAPTQFEGQLQDRASYRYWWQLLERAQSTAWADAPALPAELQRAWFG
jgi:citrate lyase subunit beta/citryl-CoA lyase